MTNDIVIPARNEAETIAPVMAAWLNHPNTGRVIVVIDPETTDRTFSMVRWISFAHPHPRNSVIILKGTDPGKGQCVNQGVAEVTTERVIFCDADITGLGRKHINALTTPTVSNDQIILVPGSDQPLTGNAAASWPWVSGERNVPTWVARKLTFHGYLMEVQINRAMTAIGAQTRFVSAPDVIARYDLNPQRLAEMARDRRWAVERGLFDADN
jgi:glycosyltransferase involved in cell wall biosynthesis